MKNFTIRWAIAGRFLAKCLHRLAVALLVIFSACSEIPPIVTGTDGIVEPPTNIKDQKRQVLIEEFTGVRCVNCPAGSAAIEDLLKVHGNQLVAVSIHAGDFAQPYAQSLYDFRTTEGTQILNLLGEPFGYPTAVINRKKFSGQFDLQLGLGEWAGYIVEEKKISPKVKIDIEPIYISTTRNLNVKVTLYIQENVSEPDVRLSLMLVENNIVDLQLAPGSSSPKPDYVHKHVLRKMLSKHDGDPISSPLQARDLIEKSFQFTLPAGWKEKDCKVVAFVNLAGTDKTVLQAHEAKLVN